MLLQPYKPIWAVHFTQISEILFTALNGLAVRIEHIGSTAVPLLAAKPIIDIDIVLEGEATFEEVKDRLESISYYHNGNQGIADREVFKRLVGATPNATLDGIAHHLYVCPADSAELQRHLLFRNYLRSNEAARIAYQNLKQSIAHKAQQNRKLYAALKEAEARGFIEEIVNKSGFCE